MAGTKNPKGEVSMRTKLPKFHNSDWKRRISHVLIFTMLLSAFMHEGWFKPSKAYAAAVTRNFQQNTGTSVGADGSTNWVTSGTTIPIRDLMDTAVPATSARSQPTLNTTPTVVYQAYSPAITQNTTIAAGATVNMWVRESTAVTCTETLTYNLYDYDPNGTAGNGTLIGTVTVTSTTLGATTTTNMPGTLNNGVYVLNASVGAPKRLRLDVVASSSAAVTLRIYSGTGTASSLVSDETVVLGDALTVSANTAIAGSPQFDNATGVVMQRFQVDSSNASDGTVVLSSLTLDDTGTATSSAGAKVYISPTSSTTLPVGAVLIGSAVPFTAASTVITLSGGTAADRTVTNGTGTKYIYIVYDMASGQAGNSVRSSVTAVGVASPDTGAGSVGLSNLITLQAGPVDPSTIKDCSGCHGNPPVDNATRDGLTGRFPGTHDTHAGATNYNISCTACHVSNAANDHRTGYIDMANPINGNTGAAYSKGTVSFPQSNSTSFVGGRCSNTYCHSAGTSVVAGSIASNTSPSWGQESTTCQSCHGAGGNDDGRPNYANGSPKRNTHGDGVNYGTTHKSTPCTTCHVGVSGSAGAYTISDTTTHNNGAYDLINTLGYSQTTGSCASPGCHGGATWGGSLTCVDCHSAPISSPTASSLSGGAVTQRVAITPDFSLTSRHIRSRTASPAVTNQDCGVCHMEGDAATGAINPTYHKNGYIELRDPDLGTTIKGVTHSGTTSAPGVYTSTATDARPVRFSRNLGSATIEADSAAIMVNLCLKCHDANGASNASARETGATAGQPFGAAIAANPSSNVLDVAGQFASTNRSFHPVLVRQNNGYVNTGGTRMVAPWNLVTTSSTTLVYGPLITCWDCHSTRGLAGTITSSGVHGGTPNGVDAVELRGNVYTNGTTTLTNLCINCHVVSGGTTNHGSGSAITSTTTAGMTYFQNRCYFCHASDVTRTRPWGAGDAHGYSARGGTVGNNQAFPAVNNGYAFLRSEGWYGNAYTQSIRAIGATTYTPTCGGRGTTGGGAGACSRSSMGGYTPGGVY